MNAPADRVRLGLVVALLAVGAVFLWSVQRDRARVVGDLAETQADLDAMADGVTALRAQVDTLGGEPVVDVEEGDTGPVLVEVPGPQGPPGPAPTDAAVRGAVEAYCAANGCTGPQGPAPSATQVAAAVSTYCDSRGQCAGTPGTDGAAGATGEAGAAGPQGPGPSDAQVAAAVATYCAANDGCRGPAGPTGEQGPQGEPGPAPTSWTFTWVGTTWECTDENQDLAYECSPT